MTLILRSLFLLFGALFSVVAAAQQVKILAEDIDVEISPVVALNTAAEETNMSITPNGKTMFFMSDRGGQAWSIPSFNAGRLRYDGDIWRSDKRGDTWGKPVCLSVPVNSYKGEDEPNVSPDGTVVVFQSWKSDWKYTGGPYYASRLYGNKWGAPVGLGSGINEFFSHEMDKYGRYGTDGAALSPDGQKFIVACGENYYGNLDIYMSVKDRYGRWSKLEKLDISTPANERSVFFGSDSKTLYFSSDGYGGSGGLDIFKTTIDEKGKHGEIINLGPKFNTDKNDYGFIIAADGKEAYFVRNGDIMRAKIKNAPEEMLASATGMVKGKVVDGSDSPLRVRLEMVDASSGETVSVTTSDGLGQYWFHVNDATKEYKVLVYREEEERDNKPAVFDQNEAYSEVVVNFKLEDPEPEPEPEPEPVVEAEAEEVIEERPPRPEEELDEAEPEPDPVGAPTVVKNKVYQYLYFPYKSPKITVSERFKLNATIDYLRTNPDLKFMVTGYGDHLDSYSFNRNLAIQRSVNVASYLIGAEIDPDRLIVEFYPQAYKRDAYGKQTIHKHARKVELSMFKEGMSLEGRNLLNLDSINTADPGTGFGLFNEDLAQLNELNHAIQLNPTFPENYFERGMIHSLMTDNGKALSDFKKAESLGMRSLELFYYKAIMEITEGDHASALESLNTAATFNPNDLMMLVKRGQVKQKLGDSKGACADWKKAERLSPGIARSSIEKYCK